MHACVPFPLKDYVLLHVNYTSILGYNAAENEEQIFI